MRTPKTVKALAKEMCLREGKKKSVNIAQMTEVLGVFADIMHDVAQDKGIYEAMDVYEMLMQYGAKRKCN